MIVYQSINNDDCDIFLWKITESENELLESAQLCQHEEIEYLEISNKQRKLEWLCTRVLTNKYFGAKQRIEYNNDGKPFLTNKISIGISHSNNIVACIYSKNFNVAVDIEQKSERILSIAHKFLNTNELEQIQNKNSISLTTAYWCAKECLYKLNGTKGVNFAEQIEISHIIAGEQTSLIGKIETDRKIRQIPLNLFEFENMIIVWGKEKTPPQ